LRNHLIDFGYQFDRPGRRSREPIAHIRQYSRARARRFSHDLLVGQFANAGDTQSAGFIAAYDMATGKFDGLLQDANGKPLVIQGIWALAPGNVSPSNLDPNAAPPAQIYFTAGPIEQTAGLFGYLTAVPKEVTQGSDQ